MPFTIEEETVKTTLGNQKHIKHKKILQLLLYKKASKFQMFFL